MQTNPESAAVEAVAVVMRDGNICWLNSWLMSDNYVKSQQGDKLYPQSALDALRGEIERRKSAQAALSQYASAAEQRADAAERRVAELEAALRDLIDVADPVALAPREYERIREQTARGTCVSIDPFPLLKCRYEDVVDLTDGLKRAGAALTKESP